MTAQSKAEPTPNRRGELLTIAAGLFATKGFTKTTVRDIADAAGILSGSLYHHFDSKESMVDEILSSFQAELFGAYDAILLSDDDARTQLERAVTVSFEAIDRHRDEVAIFQNDAGYLGRFERFGYLAERNAQSRAVWITLLENGVRSGVLRAELDVELTYRFIRDTVWVAVAWYRPGGKLTHDVVARQYLSILLDGIAQPIQPNQPNPGDLTS
ncbi:MAG: TetR/AcrR family transcriptional regulator [Nocardioides sp.]